MCELICVVRTGSVLRTSRVGFLRIDYWVMKTDAQLNGLQARHSYRSPLLSDLHLHWLLTCFLVRRADWSIFASARAGHEICMLRFATLGAQLRNFRVSSLFTPCWPWVWLYKSTPSSHTHPPHPKCGTKHTSHPPLHGPTPHMAQQCAKQGSKSDRNTGSRRQQQARFVPEHHSRPQNNARMFRNKAARPSISALRVPEHG